MSDIDLVEIKRRADVTLAVADKWAKHGGLSEAEVVVQAERAGAVAADVLALLAQLETARGLLMDCWHQLDGDVYVLPGGEVHPGAVTTIHDLHAFLWPEGKTI